jgi:hypothetical protein
MCLAESEGSMGPKVCMSRVIALLCIYKKVTLLTLMEGVFSRVDSWPLLGCPWVTPVISIAHTHMMFQQMAVLLQALATDMEKNGKTTPLNLQQVSCKCTLCKQ